MRAQLGGGRSGRRWCVGAIAGGFLLTAAVATSTGGQEPESAAKPSSPQQAAEDDTDVRGWIADLASPNVQTREAATRSLVAAGARAMPHLRAGLGSQDREVRARAEFAARTLESKAAEQLRARGIQVNTNSSSGAVGRLSVHNCTIEVDDVRQMKCVYRLRSLALTKADFTKDALKRLQELNGLGLLQMNRTDDGPSNIDDDWLECAAKLKSLDAIELGRTRATDVGLAHLGRLKSLRVLHIFSSNINGSGLAPLGELQSLEDVTIHSARLDDKAMSQGLKAFRQHGKLRVLRLSGRGLSDAALPAVANLKSLQVLGLDSTSVSDSGLKTLQKLPKLYSLNVSNTRITDKGMHVLAAYPALKYLRLDGTAITVDGLLALGASKTLRRVHFNVEIDDEDSLRLRKAWPWLAPPFHPPAAPQNR